MVRTKKYKQKCSIRLVPDYYFSSLYLLALRKYWHWNKFNKSKKKHYL